MKNILRIFCCMLLSVLILSCRRNRSSDDGNNSIYYWRTTFTLSDSETEFLHRHDIRKIYTRFFDVTYTYNRGDEENIIPEATIQFIDSFPKDIELVPTVYITHRAISEMELNEQEYAEKIVRRVNAICQRNNLNYAELQLDCDWSKSTAEPFFQLCEAVKNELDSTQCLSSTIRLHQLTQAPPPVDKGVLMIYNTGNLMELSTDNSILSLKDTKPYLTDNRLANYPLPLDVAYPTYGWSIVYSHEGGDKYRFSRIMRRTVFTPYPIKKIGQNLYEATSTVNFSDESNYPDWIFTGDRIRVERPTVDDILEIKNLIDRQLADKAHSNILYHLDDSQISHYSNNEISKIYRRN